MQTGWQLLVLSASPRGLQWKWGQLLMAMLLEAHVVSVKRDLGHCLSELM